MIHKREHGCLYYETYGEGDTIIFLNGFASGISTWYPVIKYLRKQYRCILYDYIGTGESINFPNYVFSLNSYCSDLASLIETIGAKRVHLVGYSMGGWVAQHFMAENASRVKSLVLINTSSKIFSRQNWIITHLINVLRDSDISEFSKLMFISYYSPEYFEKNSETLERIKALAELTLTKQKKENWENLLGSCLPFNAESSLSNLNIPVLILSGEHDFLCPQMTAKRFKKIMPNAQWHEFKGVGHAIPMECYQQLRDAILTFLYDSVNQVSITRRIGTKQKEI